MYTINGNFLSIDTLSRLHYTRNPIQLSEDIQRNVRQCYDYLHEKIAEKNAPYYGINTGFGSLCKIEIGTKELKELQHNLVKSHACGTGDRVPLELVRLMLFLKIQNLSLGHSGVHPNTLARLVEMYNADILPVVFQLGSLGASGDLAPLAHLSLPLIGEGEVYYKKKRLKSSIILAEKGWSAIQLQAKEGLALLNGTQFSLAYGSYACMKAIALSNLADMIAAISIDAFACTLSPFDERLHRIRPHQGQIDTAKKILEWLEGSALAALPKNTVQDPYAFRCVPQVHGASKNAIAHVKQILETEMNSVTDNPNIFPETDAILSGGNFHAQPIALALDYLAIALAELGNIAERRIYQLVSGKRNLPPFLVSHSGLHSGLMIAQYTAASVVSQNKQLCTPASVDSIISCNGQEDHVSMAANAGTKLYKVVQNVERLLAIELMTATQALSFRTASTSTKLVNVIREYRKVVPVLEKDRILHKDIEASIAFLQQLMREMASH